MAMGVGGGVITNYKETLYFGRGGGGVGKHRWKGRGVQGPVCLSRSVFTPYFPSFLFHHQHNEGQRSAPPFHHTRSWPSPRAAWEKDGPPFGPTKAGTRGASLPPAPVATFPVFV
jgi:hypothetical protein